MLGILYPDETYLSLSQMIRRGAASTLSKGSSIVSVRPSGHGRQPGRPSALLLLSEPWRSAMEFGALTVSAPALAWSPRGDGHPVLVLPGLLASDASTLILRRFLTRLGYATAGWGLGLNVGPTNEVVRRLPLRLGELFDRYEQPVSIIGWSLGGVYARALAARSPDQVRLVVTLGSPYASQGLATPTPTRHTDICPAADTRRRPGRRRAPACRCRYRRRRSTPGWTGSSHGGSAGTPSAGP